MNTEEPKEPQAQAWVGLSYEEADRLILHYPYATFKFVRAIEQALKDKNAHLLKG